MRLALAITLIACLAGCRFENFEWVDAITVRGEPVTLIGKSIFIEGAEAPDVRIVGKDMKDIRLSDFRGQTVILATVPSLDTGVCSAEAQTFNERAAALADDTVIIVASMDLPMAQNRWCGAHGVDRIITGSDYMYREISDQFGIRIKENGLLARAVFVIDPDGVITYAQVVPELSSQPDFDAAFDAAERASGR